MLNIRSTFVYISLFFAIFSASAQNDQSNSDFAKQWAEAKQMYEQGNQVEACALFMLMSYAGIVEGTHAMGHCYRDGKGVPQSFIKAAKYFECAALQDFYPSQLALATLLSEGKVESKDGRDSYFWFSMAAANSSAPAKIKDAAATMRDSVLKKMNSKQIRKSQELTSNWKISTKNECYFK